MLWLAPGSPGCISLPPAYRILQTQLYYKIGNPQIPIAPRGAASLSAYSAPLSCVRAVGPVLDTAPQLAPTGAP